MKTEMTLRPIERADVRPLREAVAADAADTAELLLPTHVLTKPENGQERIVGYGSAGVARLLAGWTAKGVSDEDSRTALRLLEQAATAAGHETLIICAAPDCRFKPLLPSEGWLEGKAVTVFFKRTKGQ